MWTGLPIRLDCLGTGSNSFSRIVNRVQTVGYTDRQPAGRSELFTRASPSFQPPPPPWLRCSASAIACCHHTTPPIRPTMPDPCAPPLPHSPPMLIPSLLHFKSFRFGQNLHLTSPRLPSAALLVHRHHYSCASIISVDTTPAAASS